DRRRHRRTDMTKCLSSIFRVGLSPSIPTNESITNQIESAKGHDQLRIVISLCPQSGCYPLKEFGRIYKPILMAIWIIHSRLISIRRRITQKCKQLIQSHNPPINRLPERPSTKETGFQSASLDI